jgi:hypothetical protein
MRMGRNVEKAERMDAEESKYERIRRWRRNQEAIRDLGADSSRAIKVD